MGTGYGMDYGAAPVRRSMKMKKGKSRSACRRAESEEDCGLLEAHEEVTYRSLGMAMPPPMAMAMPAVPAASTYNICSEDVISTEQVSRMYERARYKSRKSAF